MQQAKRIFYFTQKHWLPLLLNCAVVLFCGCGNKRSWADKEKNIWYRITDEKYKGDFVLEDLEVKPFMVHQQAGGIGLSFSFELNRRHTFSFTDVSDLDYQRYRLMARVLLPDGTPVYHTRVQLSGDTLETKVEQKLLFRTSATLPPHLFFPYRNMQLPAGTRQVVIELKGYPEYGPGRKQAGSDLFLRAEVGFVQPGLYVAQVGVESFSLDTLKVDPHSYDFRMGGTGYPDLCWKLYCGPDLVHSSPVAKNKVRFTYSGHTKPFIFAKGDSLRLHILDDDNLSNHDLIGIWNLSATGLAAGSDAVKPMVRKIGNAIDCRVWAEVRQLQQEAPAAAVK